MKRFVVSLSAAFIAAVILIGFAFHSANAGWVNTPLKFQISNQGGPLSGTAIWVRDTTVTRLNGAVAANGGALDTTNAFIPTGVGIVGPGVAVSSARDSLLCGWLIFQTDSTVSTGAMSSLQIAIDGRIGGLGSPTTLGEWVFLDSLSVAIANGTDAIQIPIKPRGVTGLQTIGFPELRARTADGVGNLPSARGVWRHWVAEEENRK